MKKILVAIGLLILVVGLLYIAIQINPNKQSLAETTYVNGPFTFISPQASFNITYSENGEQALLTYDDTTYKLTRAMSGSGARYTNADESTVFWEHGGQASLTINTQDVVTGADLLSQADMSAKVAENWFTLQLDLVKTTPGFTPPLASRAFGYSGVALYEALLPGNPGHTSLLKALGYSDVISPELNKLEGDYDWEIVANSTLAKMTSELFANTSPENKDRIAALTQQLETDKPAYISAEKRARSKKRGEEIAGAVLAFAKTDGGDRGYERNFPESYEPPIGDGLWVSTPPQFQRAMLPYWGDNRFFVTASKSDCELPPPPAFSTEKDSDFYAEAKEVYDTTGNLTDEQNNIALFWSDDPGLTATPPGHWVSILNSILEKENSTLAEAAEVYARLGIALSDSFISCWSEKYKYNLIRPITYIQTYIDPHWNTPEITDPVITPPFPEYPSGHSVQSGAAAAVLTDFFGDNYGFVDHTHDSRGYAPRTYTSFYEAADEAAISRLYGGIHYRSAIELGVTFGECIGEKVNDIDLTQQQN